MRTWKKLRLWVKVVILAFIGVCIGIAATIAYQTNERTMYLMQFVEPNQTESDFWQAVENAQQQ